MACPTARAADRARAVRGNPSRQRQCAADPADIPDIHPDIAIVYRRKVARLAEALADARDCNEASDAIRGPIERIVLIAGEQRGAMHGDLGTVIEWAAAKGGKKVTNVPRGGMSVAVVAGARTRGATGQAVTVSAWPQPCACA